MVWDLITWEILLWFTSWFKPIVDSFILSIWNLIPELLLYWLPILIVIIFWNRIYSYLKNIIVNKRNFESYKSCRKDFINKHSL